jgi:hypothetical protein
MAKNTASGFKACPMGHAPIEQHILDPNARKHLPQAATDA